jgi:hypothetical protein
MTLTGATAAIKLKLIFANLEEGKQFFIVYRAGSIPSVGFYLKPILHLF